MNLKNNSGFTLVELLIVAIMLAILAAIVVPQFSSTTSEGEEAALKADLAGIRSALELYRQQHGSYPGIVASTGGTCTGGNKGTGSANTVQAMVDQLTLYTDAAGNACDLPVGSDFPYGPYLSDQDLPANPVTDNADVVYVAPADNSAGSLSMTGDAAGLGWKYDPTSGRFIANDTNNDSVGVPYDSY